MPPIINRREQFAVSGVPAPTVCGLRVYRNDQWDVVILSELPDNPGRSVTNAIEVLATIMLARLRVPWRKVVWIEHYVGDPDAGPNLVELPDGRRVDLNADSYSKVNLEWVSGQFVAPVWHPMTLEEVEALIGEPLAPLNE